MLALIRSKGTLFRFPSSETHKVNQIVRLFTASVGESCTAVNFQNGISIITMCHIKTRNALSLQMMEELINNITKYEDNPELRAIILTAEGPIFSAGHNLKEMSSKHGREQQKKIFNIASKLMYKIIDCPVPIIAKVDGLAAAAGCQLVAQCDLAFCSNRSTFSTPGANFGIFCSTPGVALARCVPKMTAMKMLLTGLPISSQEAAATGLVTGVCEDLDKEIETVCEAIKSKSRSVIELGKKFFYKQITMDVKNAYQIGGEQMVDNLQMPDGQEGIDSFIEKRKPLWKHK